MLRPLDDRVLIKVDGADETSAGGIIIPHEAKDPVNKGTVVAVGPGKYQMGVMIPVAVREGDRVVFNHYAGQEVDGYKLLREADVVAIIERDPSDNTEGDPALNGSRSAEWLAGTDKP